MDWLDLLAVQGTLKSLLQHHSSKASILWHSTFFTVQLSHPYMTTGKTIALTRWIFVGKVMSLLFNMLSRLVITFLPRSKCLLISWLQSPSTVILEPRKIKSDTVSTFFFLWYHTSFMCGTIKKMTEKILYFRRVIVMNGHWTWKVHIVLLCIFKIIDFILICREPRGCPLILERGGNSYKYGCDSEVSPWTWGKREI